MECQQNIMQMEQTAENDNESDALRGTIFQETIVTFTIFTKRVWQLSAQLMS